LSVLLVVPGMAPFPTEEPDERSLLAGTIQIERSPPRPSVVPLAAPRPTLAPPLAPLPHLHVAITRPHAKRPQAVLAEHPYVAPVPKPATVSAAPTAAPKRPPRAIALRPRTVATEPPAPPPTARPAPITTPLAAERDVGIGNFGESYPARPMPGMLEGLRSKISGHAFVRVAVDERGHATSVVIVSGIDDPTVREDVTRTLLAATYIPASCNGLGCAATLELRT
ncbi:MAG TPA: hypothetical protein VE591_03400, partial [Candidatus Acidoferrum sp.]|nr:hypothetical protein [Candidatus Acidoferrum sp.]